MQHFSVIVFLPVLRFIVITGGSQSSTQKSYHSLCVLFFFIMTFKIKKKSKAFSVSERFINYRIKCQWIHFLLSFTAQQNCLQHFC